MELIDNFNTDVWTRGDPAQDADYKTYRICRATPLPGPGEFCYSLFDDQGDMTQVNLKGAQGKRDPLAGIGNINIKLDEKTVTGIIIEDECVVMNNA